LTLKFQWLLSLQLTGESQVSKAKSNEAYENKKFRPANPSYQGRAGGSPVFTCAEEKSERRGRYAKVGQKRHTARVKKGEETKGNRCKRNQGLTRQSLYDAKRLKCKRSSDGGHAAGKPWAPFPSGKGMVRFTGRKYQGEGAEKTVQVGGATAILSRRFEKNFLCGKTCTAENVKSGSGKGQGHANKEGKSKGQGCNS